MSEKCLSADDLQRLHAGELAEAEAARAAGHLRECQTCAQRENALRARHDAVLGHLREMAGDPLAPAPVPTETVDEGAAKSDKPALRIEGYEVIRTLSHGGQGIVYQAIQHGTNRKVAIKVLLDGAYASPAAKRRFEREIELVAGLKHPNIVAVFHSGQTVDGRPFCAMDYVRGVPLNEYVRDKKLTMEEALALFAQVCDAVQYAHQRGVIHRDLKPSNILVAEGTEGSRDQGAKGKAGDRLQDELVIGEPKVLDFGLAKMISGPDQTLVSLTGQVVGTLPYMSPEQTLGNPDEIDTRTDVYALGVILYELLTGQYPYPVVGQMADVLKHIAETEPTPPSRAWKPDSGVASAPRGGRGTESAPGGKKAHPRSGRCPINDEVQTISLKALAKERHRRYQSAAELARDIDHYLADEPIEAKRDSGWYVLKKYLRRYRIPAAVAMGFIVLLGTSAMVSATLYVRAEQQRTTANEQRHLAESRQHETQLVADFHSSMLSEIDIEAMGRGIVRGVRDQVRSGLERTWVEDPDGRMRKRDAEEIEAALNSYDQTVSPANAVDVARAVLNQFVLKRAADALDDQFRHQPLVEAQLRRAIGITYHALGLYDQAEPHLRAALDVRRREAGPDREPVAGSLTNLASLLMAKSDYVTAGALFIEALELRRTMLGEEHPLVATSMDNLAALLRAKGDHAAAEGMYRQALALSNKVVGSEHRHVASSLTGLARVLSDKGDYAAAEPLYREAIALKRRLLGNQHPDIAASLNDLALSLMNRGDYSAAEPLFREALDLYRALRGNDQPDVAANLNNLATLLHAKRDFRAAEPVFRESLGLARKLFGNEHPNVATSLNNFANFLKDKGDYDTAEMMCREALAIRRTTLGDEHLAIANSLNNLAGVLSSKGNYAAAEPLYRQALGLARNNLGDLNPHVATCMNNLARLLLDKDDPAAAEPLFRESLALRRRLLGEAHPHTQFPRIGLGVTLARLHRFTEAELLLLDAAGLCDRSEADRHWPRVMASLVDLFDSWHAAEPNKGYDGKSAEWRAKRAEWQATTQPVATQGK